MEASTYCSSSRSAASSNHLPNLGCHHLKRCTFHVCGIRAGNTPSKLADLLRPSKRMDLSRPSIDLYKVKYHLFLRSYGASCSMWLKMHAHRTSKLGNVMCNKANLCIWDSNSNPKHGRVMPAMAMPSLFAEADEGNVVEEAAEKDVKYYMDNMSLVMENAENGVDGEVGAKGAGSNAGAKGAGSNAGAKGAGSNAGMAEAFNISSKTAFGITATVSLAALLLPLLMNSVTGALTLKTKVLSYVTLLCGFYMAWNIGANDVANAMGTSVGSGALTLRQAVLIAAVLEFSGSFLVGSHVSHTMQKGILTAGFFNGKDSLLFCGMLSSLAAAGTWLQVASSYGWPVSTTHCIVGALVGFGLIYGGVEAVYWSSLARVVSSWVISPCMGAVMSFSVYKLIRMFVYSAPNPGQAAATVAPIAVFVGVVAFSLTAFPMTGNPLFAVARAVACGSLGSYLMKAVIKREFGSLLGAYCEVPSDVKVGKANGLMGFLQDVGGPIGSQLRVVYGVFGYLQVLSACFMSFAHGANDVSNAIGPISAALAILHGTGLGGGGGGGGGLLAIGTDVLAWGGFGIVAGLLVWGYRVIATIGKKITELTPTRGFAAEFAAATVVVVASRLGLPISATHTLVGAVMGVGFARGFNNVRRETVREIVASWIITIPVGALLSVFYTLLLTRFLTGGL